MIKCIRTTSENKDFQNLVKQLDAYLKVKDGEDHSYYDQFNKIDALNYVVVAYNENVAVGCGAIKPYGECDMEVKRMYVLPSLRGQGIATSVLIELENWARELNAHKCILETGKEMHEAIKLYTKNNYQIIPNYGQYEHIENSVCFEKDLSIRQTDPTN